MARVIITDREIDEIIQESASDISHLLDLVYRIDFKLGNSRMTVASLLDLKVGDVVALDRQSTQNTLMMVGDTCLGEAEIGTRRMGTVARVVRLTT